MACPSEMWVLGMPGMSQIRLRCVRESLCTAGVWPLRDPLGGDASGMPFGHCWAQEAL